MTLAYYPLYAFSSDSALAALTFTLAVFVYKQTDKQWRTIPSAEYVVAIVVIF